MTGEAIETCCVHDTKRPRSAKYLYHPRYKEALSHCRLTVQHLVFPEGNKIRSLGVKFLAAKQALKAN